MPINLLNRILILTILLFTISCSINRTEFYVSPDGNDSDRGTQKKPFLTLQKALESIPADNPGDYKIWLADGTLQLKEGVVISSDKFNNPDVHVTIKAESGATPVISGGINPGGWIRNRDGLWEASYETAHAPEELFINGKRGTRARFPNEGYLNVKKVGEDRRTNFYFEENEFPKPKNEKDVELIFLHDWSISRIKVKDLDFETYKLTTVDTVGAKKPAFFNMDNWGPHPRYFLENDVTFIDTDNEWCYSSKQNKIILKLPENQNPENIEIVIPVSESLVKMTGTKENTVKNVSFEGITFQYCAWQIPEMGYCGVQACQFDPRPVKHGWDVVPAAVTAEWSENILFTDCAFKNLGTSGLWFSSGCKNCTLENSEVSDVSGNGIMIGEGRDRLVNSEPWWKAAPEDVALGNTIRNCNVTQCGVRFSGAIGIWCGLTAETNIQNNEVYDLPYTGISIGWMWNPQPTPCRQNSVDGNHIHHIMNVLSDGGGIYMLGLQPGSQLINNNIHDVKINAGRAESNGMFLDEGSTNVLVANNLIYNIAKSPIRFHKATTNLVKGNYLFCKNGNPPIRYNRTNEEDIQKVDNNVYAEEDVNYQVELDKIIKIYDTK